MHRCCTSSHITCSGLGKAPNAHKAVTPNHRHSFKIQQDVCQEVLWTYHSSVLYIRNKVHLICIIGKLCKAQGLLISMQPCTRACYCTSLPTLQNHLICQLEALLIVSCLAVSKKLALNSTKLFELGVVPLSNLSCGQCKDEGDVQTLACPNTSVKAVHLLIMCLTSIVWLTKSSSFEPLLVVTKHFRVSVGGADSGWATSPLVLGCICSDLVSPGTFCCCPGVGFCSFSTMSGGKSDPKKSRQDVVYSRNFRIGSLTKERMC